MKETWKARLAVGLFLLACLVPSAGMLIAPPAAPAAPAANQILASKPSLTKADGTFNLDVLRHTSDYLSDHLALRQQMITAAAEVDSRLFGVSREEKVTLGRDGWLFYTETIADYLRTGPMTDRQLWSAARTLALAKEYAQSQGAQLYVTIAPNKATLYPQYLPALGEPLPGESDRERLLPNLAEQGVDYLDLFAPFQSREDVLYYATDSHWTTRGAALGADVLNAGMGKPTDFFSGPFANAAEGHIGDLYEMLYPTGTMREPQEEAAGMTFEYTRPFRSPEDQRIETENPEQTGSLLVFRDSFGNSLYPFLAQSWGRALFSRAAAYPLTLVGEAQADTVLIELVERNLDYLVTKPAAFPSPSRVLAEPAATGGLTAHGAVEDDGAVPGCVKLSGALSGQVDDSSPLYLRVGDQIWEATPGGSWGEGETPFTLYLDSSLSTLENGEMLYTQDGILQAARLNLDEERSK